MSEAPATVSSPCISVCALNDDDICVGCYRSADEIAQWAMLSHEQKQAVLKLAYARETQVNPFL